MARPDRKNRLFKVTETQIRLQIQVATYIYSAFVRYQIKENKKAERRTERSQVYKERWNIKYEEEAEVFGNK